jgi:hypothetical protein
VLWVLIDAGFIRLVCNIVVWARFTDCQCHANGSASAECDAQTGVCKCLDHVTGDKCDACQVCFTVPVMTRQRLLASNVAFL